MESTGFGAHLKEERQVGLAVIGENVTRGKVFASP
jgi:hypothetical protein